MGFEHCLKFCRGTVAQRGMQPFLIVHVLDEVRKSSLYVSQSLIFPEIDLLGLEGLHETLGRSVIVRIALPGHADPELIHSQNIDILMSRILHPSIRMMDDSCGRFSPLESHPKSGKA